MRRTLSGSLVFPSLFLGLFEVFRDLVFYFLPLAGCTAPGRPCDEQMRYVGLVWMDTHFFECEALADGRGLDVT
jgi:hypothetical protein